MYIVRTAVFPFGGAGLRGGGDVGTARVSLWGTRETDCIDVGSWRDG